MRLLQSDIVSILDSENPTLFKAANGLRLVTDFNPTDAVNTEGVYISRPDTNNSLQVATLDSFSVYDQEVIFDIKIVTSVTNKKFYLARDAVEAMLQSKDLCDYYSKTFVADETYNETNITCDYRFTLMQTITN